MACHTVPWHPWHYGILNDYYYYYVFLWFHFVWFGFDSLNFGPHRTDDNNDEDDGNNVDDDTSVPPTLHFRNKIARRKKNSLLMYANAFNSHDIKTSLKLYLLQLQQYVIPVYYSTNIKM